MIDFNRSGPNELILFYRLLNVLIYTQKSVEKINCFYNPLNYINVARLTEIKFSLLRCALQTSYVRRLIIAAHELRNLCKTN